MGVEWPSFHRPGFILTSSGPGGLEGFAPLAVVPFGVEVSSLSENQGVRLAPSTSAPDDEVPSVVHGHGLSRRVPAVSRGSGGLLAHVLRVPPSTGGLADVGLRPSRGDIGGGVLAVSRWRNIPSRS